MDDYGGPDRRIHKVYVTRNTEYHVRANVCVAVRDRRSGRWVEGHAAIRKRLEGSLHFHENGVSPNIGVPNVGDAIYFRTGEQDLITSRLESVARPEKSIVKNYPR